METENSPTSTSVAKCCDCGCSCSLMNRPFSGSNIRSTKRKIDEAEEDNSVFTIPGLIIPQNARVEIENECRALRETLISQQQTIQDLISELDEERNASSSAANEAMSMILRLQREKAEVQMEARQFKRFVEEKTAHDQQEISALEDLLYKREQSIQSLTCEVQAYKHRMLSYGLSETEVDGDGEKSLSRNTSIISNQEGQFDFPPYEIYPPLRCNTNESQNYPDGDDETADIEKYAFGETPRPQRRLKDLEHRINELEKSPRTIQPEKEYFGTKNMLEKVIVGQSPRRSRHFRKHSTDSANSFFAMGKEMGPDSPNFGSSFRKSPFSHLDVNRKRDNSSEIGDDMNDRVYTIDSIHQGASINGVMDQKAVGVDCDDYMTSPRDSPMHSEVRDLEVQKLYARLHALEADRESMRQSIISVGTDKAQLILLKEIAENLCKEMSPSRTKPVQKQSTSRSLSFVTLFKWVVSFVFWRRKARRCKYVFGLSAKNEGLLMLLDRGPRVGQRRHVLTTNMSMSY